VGPNQISQVIADHGVGFDVVDDKRKSSRSFRDKIREAQCAIVQHAQHAQHEGIDLDDLVAEPEFEWKQIGEVRGGAPRGEG